MAGPNTASETDRGQFNDREYSAKEIYSSSKQDSDSGDDKEDSGRERRETKQKRSDREAPDRQGVEPEKIDR